MEEMRQSLRSGCSTLSSEVWLWASCICLQLFLTEVRTRRTVRCAAHAARAARAAVVYQRTIIVIPIARGRGARLGHLWSSAAPGACSAAVPPSSIAFSAPGPGGKRVLGIESIVEFALSRPRCDRPNIYRVPRCSTPAPDPWWRRCFGLWRRPSTMRLCLTCLRSMLRSMPESARLECSPSTSYSINDPRRKPKDTSTQKPQHRTLSRPGRPTPKGAGRGQHPQGSTEAPRHRTLSRPARYPARPTARRARAAARRALASPPRRAAPRAAARRH